MPEPIEGYDPMEPNEVLQQPHNVFLDGNKLSTVVINREGERSVLLFLSLSHLSLTRGSCAQIPKILSWC